MVPQQTRVLTAKDGREVSLRQWSPARAPRCVIQIIHGMGEHAGRYARFAGAAAERGFAVCAHNHRGHGEHTDVRNHFADAGGWQLLNDDVQLVNDDIRQRFARIPVVMLGHSMGSFLAQTFAMHFGARLSGLILSGSTWPSRLQVVPALLIARIESWRLGVRGKSPLLDTLGFGSFNRQFAPTRTDYDWLSRDEAEVDKYVASEICGGPFSCAAWKDLLGGLFDISTDAAIGRVPGHLPILITGGAVDPVGGEKRMSKLAMHYAQTGHARLTVKIYADGRHEMLNEINRDEVMNDWFDWTETTIRTSR
jgi:alpha-beta hydrolase superfamily lysophospholipase